MSRVHAQPRRGRLPWPRRQRAAGGAPAHLNATPNHRFDYAASFNPDGSLTSASVWHEEQDLAPSQLAEATGISGLDIEDVAAVHFWEVSSRIVDPARESPHGRLLIEGVREGSAGPESIDHIYWR